MRCSLYQIYNNLNHKGNLVLIINKMDFGKSENLYVYFPENIIHFADSKGVVFDARTGDIDVEINESDIMEFHSRAWKVGLNFMTGISSSILFLDVEGGWLIYTVDKGKLKLLSSSNSEESLSDSCVVVAEELFTLTRKPFDPILLAIIQEVISTEGTVGELLKLV